jgi:hypothetical protein
MYMNLQARRRLRNILTRTTIYQGKGREVTYTIAVLAMLCSPCRKSLHPPPSPPLLPPMVLASSVVPNLTWCCRTAADAAAALAAGTRLRRCLLLCSCAMTCRNCCGNRRVERHASLSGAALSRAAKRRSWYCADTPANAVPLQVYWRTGRAISRA